jgi:hypothetical protein
MHAGFRLWKAALGCIGGEEICLCWHRLPSRAGSSSSQFGGEADWESDKVLCLRLEAGVERLNEDRGEA